MTGGAPRYSIMKVYWKEWYFFLATALISPGRVSWVPRFWGVSSGLLPWRGVETLGVGSVFVRKGSHRSAECDGCSALFGSVKPLSIVKEGLIPEGYLRWCSIARASEYLCS